MLCKHTHCPRRRCSGRPADGHRWRPVPSGVPGGGAVRRRKHGRPHRFAGRGHDRRQAVAVLPRASEPSRALLLRPPGRHAEAVCLLPHPGIRRVPPRRVLWQAAGYVLHRPGSEGRHAAEGSGRAQDRSESVQPPDQKAGHSGKGAGSYLRPGASAPAGGHPHGQPPPYREGADYRSVRGLLRRGNAAGGHSHFPHSLPEPERRQVL